MSARARRVSILLPKRRKRRTEYQYVSYASPVYPLAQICVTSVIRQSPKPLHILYKLLKILLILHSVYIPIPPSSQRRFQPEVVYPVRVLKQCALGDAERLGNGELESPDGCFEDL